MLATRTESQMTIYNFIKDRIEDGSFVLLPSQKKSRKALGLSAELEVALNAYLEQRYSDASMADGSKGLSQESAVLSSPQSPRL